MNNVTMNPAMNSNVANSLLGTGTQAQTAVQNGDFFAAFLQMITGQGGGTDVMSGLGAGLENGYIPTADDDNAEDNQAAMEMAAGLLSGNYGFDWLLSGNTESNELSYFSNGALSGLTGLTGLNGDLMSQLGLANQSGLGSSLSLNGAALQGQQAEMNLAQLMGAMGEGQGNGNPLESLLNSESQENPFASENSGSKILSQMMTLQNLESAVNAYKNAQATAVNAGDRILAGNQMISGDKAVKTELQGPMFNSQSTDKSTAEGQIISEIKNISVFSDQNSENSSEMLYNGDMGFKSAVAQAQRLMKKEDSSKEELSFDIDSETVANAGTAQTATAAMQEAGAESVKVDAIDLDDLSQQINAGLSKGELTEKKELSVKLKPEGLGEVTIKLVKEANQIKISIVTAGEQTARLLNDNLPNLKQSMQGMGTDVSEVFVERQGAQTEQGFLNSQMFMGQQQQNAQEQTAQRSSFRGQDGYYTDAEDAELKNASSQRLVESGMRIYA